MAKATALCTCAFCGAKFEKIAYKASRREADEWAAWAAKNFDQCPNCYKEGERANAKEAAESAGLPALVGSPKQIAWAEGIRSKLWAQYLSCEADAETWAAENGQTQAFEAGKAAIRGIFERITSAKEYIDGRDLTVDQFVNRYINNK